MGRFDLMIGMDIGKRWMERKGLLLIILGVWFGVIFYGLESHSQSLYFQDETEHVTVGWMVSRFGRKLYSDLTSNHQPIPIFAGMVLAETIPYNTLFQFIDRLRSMMVVFQMLAGGLLVLRFGRKGLVTVVLYTSFIYFYFGWYVLAESLAAPMVAWVMLELLAVKGVGKKSEVIKKEWVGLSLVVGVAGFTLLPLWLFLIASWWWRMTNLDKRERVKALLVLLVVAVAVCCWVSPGDWWRETVINNVRYFLPFEGGLSVAKMGRLLVFPLLGLSHLGFGPARFYVVGFLLLVMYGLSCRREKRKGVWVRGLIFWMLLFSLNLRVSSPADIFYSGFGLFPYAAGFSALVAQAVVESRGRKQIVLGLMTLSMLWGNSAWVGEKVDKMNEYFVNYGTFEAYGRAIEAIAPDGASLITGPDGAGYMNMMANVPVAGRQNFHLNWAYRTPELREAFEEMLGSNPPTFVYFVEDENNGFYRMLKPRLESDYVALKRRDGSETRLMVNRQVLVLVTEQQWLKLEDLFFQRPEIERNP